MLDIGFHQGAGLHSFTPQSELRVLAVASQNNAASALETLWQICAHLQRLGLPVVVLDGTAQETEDSPGLLHLLLPARRIHFPTPGPRLQWTAQVIDPIAGQPRDPARVQRQARP